MEERGRVGLAVLVGAVIGGMAGYLFFTEQGRRLRAQIEPRLADLMDQVQHWRQTVETVRTALVDEGPDDEGRAAVAGPAPAVTGASRAGGTS